MADEKLNPGQGEQIKLDISGESPGPDLTGEGPPAPEPGDVVVATSKIDGRRRVRLRLYFRDGERLIHLPKFDRYVEQAKLLMKYRIDT